MKIQRKWLAGIMALTLLASALPAMARDYDHDRDGNRGNHYAYGKFPAWHFDRDQNHYRYGAYHRDWDRNRFDRDRNFHRRDMNSNFWNRDWFRF